MPSQTVPPGAGVVGTGPTAIDFSDQSHGWIASGGNAVPPTHDPTIVHTSDGGHTWQRTPVPNFAALSVNAGTNLAFGGLVGIHFSSAARGWFFQAGIGWQTNDAGAKWTELHLPVDGALVALTSVGSDVWALVDTCPIDALSCPQNMGKGSVYYATSARVLRWHRVGGFLPAGYGVLYPKARESVVVAFGPLQYRRAMGRTTDASSIADCGLVGPLRGRALAGVCDAGRGGNASASSVAIFQ